MPTSTLTRTAAPGAAVPDLLVQTLDGVWRPTFHVRDRVRDRVYVSSYYVHLDAGSYPLTAEQLDALREQGRVSEPPPRPAPADGASATSHLRPGLFAYFGAGLTAWVERTDEPGRFRLSLATAAGVELWVDVDSAPEARRQARAYVAAARRAQSRKKLAA